MQGCILALLKTRLPHVLDQIVCAYEYLTPYHCVRVSVCACVFASLFNSIDQSLSLCEHFRPVKLMIDRSEGCRVWGGWGGGGGG